MGSGITCIVTIHGIGFQEPPLDGVAGYADDLHMNLCSALNQDGDELLSDDPGRQQYQVGTSVPIYVQSVWPPRSRRREDGLKRLGSWDEDHLTVSVADAPLVKGNARIAHVALVYSGLEGEGPEVGASVVTGGMAAVSARHYSHVTALLDMLFLDIMQPLVQSLWTNMLEPRPQDNTGPRPSLRIRQDEGYPHHNGSTRHLGGIMALLRQLENDVAVYVCHNGRRQRVRSFILDALLRLAFRKDVESIVLNTHSNGTVIGLDVLQELPPIAAKKIRAVITAGSPIRKYVDLFGWGEHLAVVPKIKRWDNFLDAQDIVADRLRPRAGWRRGDEEPAEEELVGIYQALDYSKGELSPMPINDIHVNNMTNSPVGGLRAHNYWENTKEFIPAVVKILRDVMAEAELDVV